LNNIFLIVDGNKLSGSEPAFKVVKSFNERKSEFLFFLVAHRSLEDDGLLLQTLEDCK
jgi:hypothetical protein